ncbi:MAG: CHAD domain-containing protein [Phyllobacterium sp.]
MHPKGSKLIAGQSLTVDPGTMETTTDAVPPSAGNKSPANGSGKPPQAAASTEIELKLLADPQRLGDLAQSPVVALYSKGRGAVHQLVATYYDTPDLALKKAGYAMRVRRSGQRFIMTLKTDQPLGSDMLRRGEWETPVPGPEPDRQWLLSRLPEEKRKALEPMQLEPVFTTQVRRETHMLTLPSGQVELALDRGQIISDSRSDEISEAELELKEGNAALLFQIAHELNATTPLRPSTDTKAARGFRLFQQCAPETRKPPKLSLGPKLPLDDALAEILRAALLHLLDNQAAAADGRDPEGVHQVRVALRRLRAALSLIRHFAPSVTIDALRADAQWLASAMGDARNWDVFLTQALPEIEKGCPSADGFGPLRAASESIRKSAYEKAVAALSNPRTGQFAINLGLWIEQRGWRADVSTGTLAELAAPAADFGRQILERRHEKALKRGRGLSKLSVDERHKLRLALKKLRYTADFFLPLIGKRKNAARYGRQLAALQDVFGQYNDAMTTIGLMAELRRHGLPQEAQMAGGAVMGWAASTLSHMDPQLQSAWKDFTTKGLLEA